MALLLDHLALDELPPPQLHGTPLSLPIDSIDEDPEQPRREFEPEAMAELAQTIEARGVRQPVSVRPHPQHPGRWMLNFGARRLRASKLAGKAEIPAFVDVTADSYDQVIENEHREGLKPMELALFVQKQLAAGERAAEIAKRLGKSRGYLTFVCALIDPPDWLADLYRSGRCRGLQELYELRRLHAAQPVAVEQWLAQQTHVARGDVLAYRQSLQQIRHQVPNADHAGPAVSKDETPGERVTPALARTLATRPAPPTLALVPGTADVSKVPERHLALWGDVQGIRVQVLLGPTPPEADMVFVIRAGAPQRTAAHMADIQDLRLAVI